MPIWGMYHEVGEVFELEDGTKLQVMELEKHSLTCRKCYFIGENSKKGCYKMPCFPYLRPDGKFTYYIKFEKDMTKPAFGFKPIKQVFDHNGMRVMVEESKLTFGDCPKCAFFGNCKTIPCMPFSRKDGKSVYYRLIKKL